MKSNSSCTTKDENKLNSYAKAYEMTNMLNNVENSWAYAAQNSTEAQKFDRFRQEIIKQSAKGKAQIKFCQLRKSFLFQFDANFLANSLLFVV